MKCTPEHFLSIARAEIGYKEKASNSQLDDKNTNAGKNNYTKYARDLYAAGYYNGNKQGVAWCDMFYDWCLYMACGKNKRDAEEMQYQSGNLGAGCNYSAQYYKSAGKFYLTPHIGDQVFFNGFNHTGIVESISGRTITTIEGNADNMVKRCTYTVDSNNIDGYGRPNWAIEATVAPSVAWKGVDLSYANGQNVDFNKLKAAGVKFAILRAGYGRYARQKDSVFEANYAKAKAAGIPIGCYWYSYASDVAGAKAEAKAFLEVINGKQFEFPVFYDIEENKQFSTGRETVSAIAAAFLATTEAAGYFSGLYMSRYYLMNYITNEIQKRYTLWVAEYGDQCRYSGPGRVAMWQCSDSGSMDGVEGRVDIDYCYEDYISKIKKQSLNGFTESSANVTSAMQGDLDGDRKVTSADARIALRAAAKLESLTDAQTTSADVDMDGQVTSADARDILRKAAHIK